MNEINEKQSDEEVIWYPTGVFSDFTEAVLSTTRDFCCNEDLNEKTKIMVKFLEKMEEYINDMEKKINQNDDHQVLDTYCFLFKDPEDSKAFIHKLKKEFQKQVKK